MFEIKQFFQIFIISVCVSSSLEEQELGSVMLGVQPSLSILAVTGTQSRKVTGISHPGLRINVPALLQHPAHRNALVCLWWAATAPRMGSCVLESPLEILQRFYPLFPCWSPVHLSAPFYLSQIRLRLNEANEFNVMQI